MTVKQIFAQIKKLAIERRSADTVLPEWAIRDLTERLDQTLRFDWRNTQLQELPIDLNTTIPSLYDAFRETLQLIGMQLTTGNKRHDQSIWKNASQTLGLMREVLIKNFSVELPEAQVVSMTEDMLESGVLEKLAGEGAQTYLRLKQSNCDLKIRIIKTPAGPAPENVRAKWVGLVLPAFRHPGNERYAVPIMEGLQVLQSISPEGAKWFVENFGVLGNFLFHLKEAEIVAA